MVYLRDMGIIMKVLIFGTGCIFKENRHKFTNFDILAFLDNDRKKQGQLLEGKTVVLPEEHWRYEYDAIIIASIYFQEMREQLLNLGIPENKIVDEEHLGSFSDICIIREYRKKISYNSYGKKILLVASELRNVGATIVLFNAAQLLVSKGFRVDLIASIEGPMLYSFLGLGINVKIAEWWDMFEKDVLEEYDLIFLNSILTYPIEKKIAGTGIPVLWWWHEDLTFMNDLKVTKENIFIEDNIHILAVGERVKNAYISLFGSCDVEELCFGLNEHKAIEQKQDYNKVICAIVGCVSKTKGHDILLKAIKLYQGQWNNQIEFWIIGSITEEQRKEFEKYSCIRVWGVIEHARLMELYSEIDIVLCASRYESMSAAIIEGMMHKKLCITSSETGIAEYCEPYVNALIMESENVMSLVEQINWALSNRDSWERISEAGYKVFDNKFRMEIFEEKLLYYVNKYCL